MSVRLLGCAVVGLVLAASPAAAADPPKPGTTEHTLAALRQPVSFDRVNETSVHELVQRLAEKFEIMFVIRDEAFRAVGQASLRDERPRFTATPIQGMSLHRFLTVCLNSVNATYLVRKDHVEIVPVVNAAKETKNLFTEEQGDGTNVRLKEPLVAVAYKEKPLTEALADLAEEYDLTVVLGPQAGDARTGFVTARLLNVPADRAVELLALQADLRVVRRGTAYLVTSKDNADALESRSGKRSEDASELLPRLVNDRQLLFQVAFVVGQGGGEFHFARPQQLRPVFGVGLARPIHNQYSM